MPASKIGLQVLSLGMSRTGTASMKEALKILGHERVHHAYELYTYPEQSQQWLNAWEAKLRGDNIDWSFLQDYTAVTDMPAVCFAAELIEAFPDAKVILVEREENAWLKSFKTGVIDTYFDNASVTWTISLFDHKLMRPIHALWTRLFATPDGFFKSTTREEMTRNALSVYRQHNDVVRRPGVLRYKLGEWKPLCEFLGEEIPDVAFPNVNEGDAIKDVVASFVNKSMMIALRNVAVGVAVVAVVAYKMM